eukprot:6491912-Amphidinium_carterae.4
MIVPPSFLQLSLIKDDAEQLAHLSGVTKVSIARQLAGRASLLAQRNGQVKLKLHRTLGCRLLATCFDFYCFRRPLCSTCMCLRLIRAALTCRMHASGKLDAMLRPGARVASF